MTKLNWHRIIENGVIGALASMPFILTVAIILFSASLTASQKIIVLSNQQAELNNRLEELRSQNEDIAQRIDLYEQIFISGVLCPEECVKKEQDIYRPK